MATFLDVKKILNAAATASRALIGPVDLKAKHKEASFPDFYGDFSNKDLQAGFARGMQLIQPGVLPAPGKIGDQGEHANIVLALRGTLPKVRQMPGGGPAVSEADILTIVDWINHGCPD